MSKAFKVSQISLCIFDLWLSQHLE